MTMNTIRLQSMLNIISILILLSIGFRSDAFKPYRTICRYYKLFTSTDRLPSPSLQDSSPKINKVKNRINEIVPVSKIESVRFRYIKVATEDLAISCKDLLLSNTYEFSTLAETMSLCEETKHNGGDTGMVYIKNPTSNTNVLLNTMNSVTNVTTSTSNNSNNNAMKALDLSPYWMYPVELINAACYMKKGDLKIISISSTSSSSTTSTLSSSSSSSSSVSTEVTKGMSEKDWYIIQLLDVQTELSPLLKRRQTKSYQDLFTSSSKSLKSTLSKDQAVEKEMIIIQQPLKYYIETMGCQMNSADSERIEGQLQQLGYEVSQDIHSSNLVILNTCSIRDHAEQKVYSKLGPHALRKRKGEDVTLVIAGCVAQQEGEEVLKRFPEVDIVMGPQYANRIDELLMSVYDGHQVVATEPTYQTEDTLTPYRKSDISAWVNVIYGCNERCTYCVVPYTRGVEQSRTKEAIIQEITELVQEGYQEVILLGQNIDSWGRDMTPKQKFADLLRAVAAVPGLGRVRFLTSHPKYMSERVIQAVAENSNIAPNLNVPFQSGDNEVLKNMRRGYTRERYLEIIHTIKSYMPDASITADCIVGFPGETEEQFQNTLSLMEEVKFDMLNTAAYSPRPNTEAAEWEVQVPDDIKQDRIRRINQLANAHAYERSQRFLNRIETVLVENINMKNIKQVYGRTAHARLCYFDGNYEELKGKFVQVKINDAKMYTLYGEMVSSSTS